MDFEAPVPNRTVALVLGASKYPKHPTLAAGASFYRSADDFLKYLTCVLELPTSNVLDLFDDPRPSPMQLADISDFLARKSEDSKASDIIIYYVGHGGFAGNDKDYFLAVRSIQAENEAASSIRVSDFAQIVRTYARRSRRYLILDCCFSASAFTEFQCAPAQVVRAQTLSAFPSRGTTLLCSSSRKVPSIAPKHLSRTMFSDALLDVLENGCTSSSDRLSISELGDYVKELLRTRYKDGFVRPEVHSPDQTEGDIAAIPLFPNPAQKPKVEQAKLHDSAANCSSDDCDGSTGLQPPLPNVSDQELAKEIVDHAQPSNRRPSHKDAVPRNGFLFHATHVLKLWAQRIPGAVFLAGGLLVLCCALLLWWVQRTEQSVGNSAANIAGKSEQATDRETIASVTDRETRFGSSNTPVTTSPGAPPRNKNLRKKDSATYL